MENNAEDSKLAQAVSDEIAKTLAEKETNFAMPMGGGSAPISLGENPTAVNDLVDTSVMLEEQELSLGGFVRKRTKDGKIEYLKARSPVMNDKGITFWMNALRGACNKNTTMSVTPPWRIPIMVGNIGLLLFKTVSTKKAEFGISDADFTEMPSRCISAMQIIEAAVRHGDSGSEQKNVWGANKTMTVNQNNGTPQPQRSRLQALREAVLGG